MERIATLGSALKRNHESPSNGVKATKIEDAQGAAKQGAASDISSPPLPKLSQAGCGIDASFVYEAARRFGLTATTFVGAFCKTDQLPSTVEVISDEKAGAIVKGEKGLAASGINLSRATDVVVANAWGKCWMLSLKRRRESR